MARVADVLKKPTWRPWESSEEAGMPDPAAIHVALQALERIAEMLAGLPAKAREAFLLSRLDGLTYNDPPGRIPAPSKTTSPRRWCIATTACMRQTPLA